MSKKRGLNKSRVDMLLSEALGLSLPEDKVKSDDKNITERQEDWSFDDNRSQESHQIKAKHNLSMGNKEKIELTAKEQQNTILQQLAIEQLSPSKFQPRRVMQEDELNELAESIQNQGILQPIVARQQGTRFEIVAGERRWRAAKVAGLQTVPVIIHTMTDEEAMVIALIENIQRENLTSLEEAYALEKLAKTIGLTHEEIAKTVGKSRATISNSLRLLQLQPEVKVLLEKGLLDAGHAKALLAITGKQQIKLARIITEKQLSVREVEQLVQQQVLSQDGRQRSSPRPLDPDIARLQRSLSEKIGSPLRILHGKQGKGKIVIKYNSIDELDGILEHIV